jgi:hypothetical protein
MWKLIGLLLGDIATLSIIASLLVSFLGNIETILTIANFLGLFLDHPILSSIIETIISIINLIKIKFTLDVEILKYVYLNITFINIKYPSKDKIYPNNQILIIPQSLQFKLDIFANLRNLSDGTQTQKYCVNTIREQIEFINSWKELINNSTNRKKK